MSHAIETARDTSAPAVIDDEAQKILALVVHGDCSKLSAEQKVVYYKMRCDAVGVDWRTRPFAYIKMPNGTEALYLVAEGAHQLRVNRGIHSLGKPDIQYQGDNIIVTVTMVDRDGRQETDIGALFVAGLKGQSYADAIMKAVTKARRRCTLALCGLGAEMVLDGDVIDTSWEPAPDEVDEQRAQMRDYNRSISGPHMPSNGLFKRFWATSREHGWHNDEVHGFILEQWGHESVNQLTHSQMMELINRMVSGPKWVDPRQSSMDLEAAIEATAREVPASDEPPVDPETGEYLDSPPPGYWHHSGEFMPPALTNDLGRDVAAITTAAATAPSEAGLRDAWAFARTVGLTGDDEVRAAFAARKREMGWTTNGS